jgi:hypothetical protein
VADGQAVAFGDFEQMVGRQRAAGSRHVVDDNGRIAGNIFAKVTRDQTRVSVVTAARRSADDDANRFAFVVRRAREKTASLASIK